MDKEVQKSLAELNQFLTQSGEKREYSFLEVVAAKSILRKIWRYDTTIYKNFVYPWYIHPRGMKPILYPLGFTSAENAKLLFKLRFGNDCLKHIHFIKGQDAIGRPFLLHSCLPVGVNGHLLHICKKMNSRDLSIKRVSILLRVYYKYKDRLSLKLMKIKYEHMLLALMIKIKGQRLYVIKGNDIYRIRSKKKAAAQNVKKHSVQRMAYAY